MKIITVGLDVDSLSNNLGYESDIPRLFMVHLNIKHGSEYQFMRTIGDSLWRIINHLEKEAERAGN